MLVRVGGAQDVPVDGMRVFDLAGVKVNVVSIGGAMYAFDDSCTHAGCSLARGTLDGTIVTCGCHGSQFDVISGAVLHGPAGQPVRARQVQVDGDDLMVDA